MHDEKQEAEREHFDFEKSAENLSEAIGIDHVQQHSDVDDEHDENLEHDDDMDKQLNPEAAEFVPTSPPASAPLSPFSNGTAALIGNRPDLLEDDMLAQSPRKSVAVVMEDITLPSENDFSEISKRPSELLPTSPIDLNGANGDAEQRPGSSSSSHCSYQEMNLKEAMHGDEKQEFAAEVAEAINLNAEPAVAELDLLQGSEHAGDVLIRSLREQDPMHMSYYNDRAEENGLPQTNPFAEPEVDMNAVQPLPDSDDDAMNEREDFDTFVSDPVTQSNGHDVGAPQSNAENEFYTENQEIPAAENDLINVSESSPITQVVQEMASEVTSILNEFDEHHHNAEQHSAFEIRDLSNDAVADVINNSGLSAEASEFSPSQLLAEVAPSPIEAEELVSIVEAASSVQPIEPVEVPVEPSVAPQQEEQKVDLLAAAGVATATAIAAAVVATAKSPSQAKEPKVTAATKKPTTLATKKPAAAPLKSTLKPAVSTARTSTTSPTKTLASKTAAAAPKPAVRTVKAPIEKKTTATLSTAAKKPVTNGVATTTIKKTTTTTTATKSTVGAPKPPVHATKTTTLRTTTTAPKPATTTASARVPLSAR